MTLTSITNSDLKHSYDKGGHLFLPSYVMRTHGARQQREAVKRAPRKQLEPDHEYFYEKNPSIIPI